MPSISLDGFQISDPRLNIPSSDVYVASLGRPNGVMMSGLA